MATITGTKRNVTIIKRQKTPYGARAVYLITADFAAYTGSTDDGALADVGAFITATVRDGKTRTMRSAVCIDAGYDGTTAIYTGACTVSSDALAFNLTNAAASELTSTSATTVPVSFFVTVDEA